MSAKVLTEVELHERVCVCEGGGGAVGVFASAHLHDGSERVGVLERSLKTRRKEG